MQGKQLNHDTTIPVPNTSHLNENMHEIDD